MSGLRELISSAFGINACLYRDVLQCSSKATPSELRKAYHKRALRYHPDKYRSSEASAVDKNKNGTGGQCSTVSGDDRLKEATIKFQALSATYQLLSNPSRRATYDYNRQIPNVDEDVHDHGTSTTSGESNAKARSQRNDEWVRFFRSVVQDMMHGAIHFDRREYCGSEQEKEDVLHNYRLCKGDRSKMMSCIVQSKHQDLERWWKDIIQPAIEEGDVENFEGISDDLRQLERGSASTNTNEMKKRKKRKRLVRKKNSAEKKMNRQKKAIVPDRGKSSTTTAGCLEDTDEEHDTPKTTSSIQKSKTMNRREKMEFRVAKKRKEKREREIEIAGIMQSKQWTMDSFGKAATGKQGKRRNNQHGLSDSFLSGLHEKFSNKEENRQS